MDFCTISRQSSNIFVLTSKIYLEKLPVITDNTLAWAISFISVYVFWNINFVILWHLYLMKLICKNIHLFKHFWKVHCVKSVHIWSFFGLYFPLFRLNMERYCRKMRTRKTQNMDTFHAVVYVCIYCCVITVSSRDVNDHVN